MFAICQELGARGTMGTYTLFTEHEVEQAQDALRSVSVASALWAQLQEIDRQRETLRGELLALSNNRELVLQLLKRLEALTVQWHRLFLDNRAGAVALSSSNIGEELIASLAGKR